jgi:predicted transcriptional regulator
MAANHQELNMSTVTIRLPDAKHERLKFLARGQNISLNKLFEEWATVALAQQDAQASYAMRQARADRQRGLEVLDKLDAHFSARSNS